MTDDFVTSSLNSWRSSTGMRLKNSTRPSSSALCMGRTISPSSIVRGNRERTVFIRTSLPSRLPHTHLGVKVQPGCGKGPAKTCNSRFQRELALVGELGFRDLGDQPEDYL